MEQKLEYMILILKERNGDYEYYHRSIHELPDLNATTIKNRTENYLKDFYGGNAKKGDDGYYFHNGEIYVSISSYKIISSEDYNVLKKYL